MKILLSVIIGTFLVQMCDFAILKKDEDMRMDEIIMHAAKSHEMFDLAHIMADGQLMVMVELDLLMSVRELAQYKRSPRLRNKRKATSFDNRLWKNCKVYYDFTEGDFSQDDQRVIERAIADWENFTCLTFTRNSTATDRIVFRDGAGCYSRLGRVGGEQPIALAPRCRQKGVVVHEIGHAIGWIHEQARPDRDDFVTVNFNQIPPNWHSQFEKVSDELINDRDVTYDYDSIMHYSGNVFGPRTIATRNPADQNRLGQRQGLSFRDIKLANLMYRCAERMKCRPRRCPGEGFQLKNCNCVCPGPIGNPLVPCTGSAVTTTTPAPPSSTTEPPVPPDPDCMDLRDDCESLKEAGSCTSDPARMSVFCRKTCELCNAETVCMDYDDACPFFASSGYCRGNEAEKFFQQECPLSCEICTADDRCQAEQDARRSAATTGISLFSSALILSISVLTTIV